MTDATELAADGDEIPEGVDPPTAADLQAAEEFFKALDAYR